MRTAMISAALIGSLAAAAGLRAEDGVPDPKELFKQLDQNGDGKLTADEVPQAQTRFFERLVRNADKNKDGQLSLEEFQQGHAAAEGPGLPLNDLGGQGRRGQGDPKRRFEMMDRNKDGKVTRDEVPEFAKERLGPVFERLGKDELTLEDFRRVAGGPPTGQNPDGEPPRGPKFLQLVDANRDGRISKSEWAKAIEKFDELDANGDGELDPRELLGPPPEGMDEMAGRMPRRMERPAGAGNGEAGRMALFERMDRNRDGRISKDEAPPPLRNRFDQLDADGDGSLSPEEARSAAPAGRPPGGNSEGGARPKRPAAE